MVNRKVYSTMTNLNNRVTANMVVGSFSSALTNFIPMVQSWHQVSPVYTVRGLGDMIRSTIHDDGTIAKSDFLTNRLIQEENLYKTGWDKVSDKAAFMMNVVDNITSQTVWRSKYLQNLHEGMSESMAIKDADQFAKNLIAGRSRGNAPSIFDAKNPLTKIFTAFQLEVANQYGYMFEDVPQDTSSKTRLAKGYTAPVISKLTVHRCDADGTENDQGVYLRVVFSAAITSLNSKNTAAYALRYKKSTDTTYTEVTLSALANTYAVSDYVYIIAADESSAYNVEVVAADRHSAAARATSASTAFSLMDWHASGTGIAFGKVAEAANLMDVALPARFRGVVDFDAVPAKCAPAGYGLGGKAKAITDPDEAVNGGIYRISAKTENMPFAFMLLLSMPYYDDWVQLGIQWTSGTMVQRFHSAANGWSEWEYVNPPMTAGVEYRTTERWMGKVVYTKLVDCGLSVSGTKVVENVVPPYHRVIRSAGYTQQFSLPSIMYSTDNAYSIWHQTDNANIRVFAGASVVGLQVYVQIWYAKVID